MKRGIALRALALVALFWMAAPAAAQETRTVRFLTTFWDGNNRRLAANAPLNAPLTVKAQFYAERAPIVVVGAVFDGDGELVGQPVLHRLESKREATLLFPVPNKRAKRFFLLMFDGASARVGELEKLVRTRNAARLEKVIGDAFAMAKTGKGGEKMKELGGVISTSASAANPSPPKPQKEMNVRAAAKDEQQDWLTSRDVLVESFPSDQQRVVRYALKFR